MNTKKNLALHVIATGAIALLASVTAHTEAIQTLDRVDVYNQANVLEMQFNNPARAFDFAALAITPVAGFKVCQITATQGLYCLDGNQVRTWPKPTQAVFLASRVDWDFGVGEPSVSPVSVMLAGRWAHRQPWHCCACGV